MSGDASEPRKAPTFEWTNHLGLLVGAAASILICLKLLAVANWNSTTAFGILAASGTANVLTGTLLAVLPLFYAAFAIIVLPRIERNLKRRTPVERSAARLVETWPVTLLIFIVPLGILLAFFVFQFLGFLRLLIRWLIERARAPWPAKAPVNEAPSRFESATVGLAAFVMLVFGYLSTPWVPSEIIVTSDGEQAAYVLKNEGGTTTVLLASDRTLIRIQDDALTGKFCQRTSGWWNEPFLELITDDKYLECPNL